MITKTYYCAYSNATYSVGGEVITFRSRCIKGFGSVFTTSDIKLQGAIEQLLDYKAGRIMIGSVHGSADEADKTAKTNNGEADKKQQGEMLLSFDEVTSIQEAIERLREMQKITSEEASAIKTREDLLAIAEQHKISFPKL